MTQETAASQVNHPWLSLARLVCAALIILSIGLNIISLPAAYNALVSFDYVRANNSKEVSAAVVAGLADLGMTSTVYAGFVVTICAISAVVLLACAVLIFLRKSMDWLALLFSLLFAYIAYGVLGGIAPIIQPPWD